MQKIMQINITCGRGSTGKLAQALYKASLQQGYDADFVYSAYTPTLPEAFPIENKFQNYLRRALNRYFGRKQCHSNPGTRRLIRHIKQEKPDIIHLHNIQQNSVNYHKLFRFLKESGIPVVYTLHDCWPITGGCFHFTKKGCKQYREGCKECTTKVHPDDITCKSRDAYESKKNLIGGNERLYPVCVSNWLRDCARASYMGKMTHLPETIYNGINTNLFSPKKSDIRKTFGIPEDAFMVLGVASFWTEEKGLWLFRDVADKLQEDAIIVLVGRQTEPVEAGNIICIPQTENQEELAELYSTADVYVNGSLEETFGMTTAEALACGTPAVVMDSTACPEVVDQNTGIVISPNAVELLGAVLQVKRNGKEAYHPYCVERARNCFSEERMTQMYLSLYRSILDGE